MIYKQQNGAIFSDSYLLLIVLKKYLYFKNFAFNIYYIYNMNLVFIFLITLSFEQLIAQVDRGT